MAERRLPKSDIERIGLTDFVNKLLFDNHTYEQIKDRIFIEKGETISISQISRHYKNRYMVGFERARMVEDLVGQMMKAEEEKGAVDTGAALRRLVLAKAMDAVVEMKSDDIGKLTPDKLALMIARLERSGVNTQRLHLVKNKAIDAAKEAILEALQRELGEDEDLMEVIRQKAEAAANKTREAAA